MILSPELEYLAYTNESFIKKLNPITKLVLLLCLLLVNLNLKGFAQLSFVFVTVVLFWHSKIPFSVIKRSIFAAFSVGGLLFLAKLHFIKMGAPYRLLVDFYPSASFTALSFGLKIPCGVILILLFVGTTPLNAALSSLAILKVPKVLIEIFLIVYKYIFIINDEGIRVKNAQAIRLGYKDFFKSITSFGNLAGILITRGANKSVNMVDAMMVRGYKGDIFFPSSVNNLLIIDYVLIILVGLFPLILSFICMP